MARLSRGLLYGALLLAIFFGTGLRPAVAAFDRPNALDRRVDALSNQALMTQPALQLTDPKRQEAAGRLVHLMLPGWIATAVFEAIALAYFWSSGGAARLRDRLRRLWEHEWKVRFAFGASLALIARLAAVPPAFYIYRVERVMGLSDELTRMWALFWIAHTAMAMIVAGLIATLVLWLVDRTHQWYVYTIVAILAVSVGWSYASPYFQAPSNAGEPPTGQLAAQLRGMLQTAGLPNTPVYVTKSPDSPIGRTVVMGLGPSRRIVLTDTLIAGDTPQEVLYSVAYEVGHVMHGDLLFIALIEGGIIIFFSALAVVVADRIGFRRDDDPLSRLALVGSLLALLYLAAVPARNAALRAYDLDADRFAVALTGDPAAAIRANVREADQRLTEVCPEMLAVSFLNTEPSPGGRVAAINHVRNTCP